MSKLLPTVETHFVSGILTRTPNLLSLPQKIHPCRYTCMMLMFNDPTQWVLTFRFVPVYPSVRPSVEFLVGALLYRFEVFSNDLAQIFSLMRQFVAYGNNNSTVIIYRVVGTLFQIYETLFQAIIIPSNRTGGREGV